MCAFKYLKALELGDPGFVKLYILGAVQISYHSPEEGVRSGCEKGVRQWGEGSDPSVRKKFSRSINDFFLLKTTKNVTKHTKM